MFKLTKEIDGWNSNRRKKAKSKSPNSKYVVSVRDELMEFQVLINILDLLSLNYFFH